MALNQAALNELRELDPDGSTGLLAQIIGTYLVDAAALIAQMRDALTAGDGASLTRHAHSLKSTSMSLGAMRVGELARDIEMAGKNNRLTDCPALLAALSAEYSLAESWLQAELAAAVKSA